MPSRRSQTVILPFTPSSAVNDGEGARRYKLWLAEASTLAEMKDVPEPARIVCGMIADILREQRRTPDLLRAAARAPAQRASLPPMCEPRRRRMLAK